MALSCGKTGKEGKCLVSRGNKEGRKTDNTMGGLR